MKVDKLLKKYKNLTIKDFDEENRYYFDDENDLDVFCDGEYGDAKYTLKITSIYDDRNEDMQLLGEGEMYIQEVEDNIAEREERRERRERGLAGKEREEAFNAGLDELNEELDAQLEEGVELYA